MGVLGGEERARGMSYGGGGKDNTSEVEYCGATGLENKAPDVSKNFGSKCTAEMKLMSWEVWDNVEQRIMIAQSGSVVE